MKTNLLWVVFITFYWVSCEENPDICLERTPIPVIYNVFNRYDSVHYTYITKTWSGDNGGTLVTAQNPDSIYFRDVTVKMDLIRRIDSVVPPKRDTIHVVPDFEWLHDKKPGMFAYPDCPVYTLRYNLEDFDAIISYISIPGYKTIVLPYNLLLKPEINFPHRDGMTIAILPDKGLIIDFKGGSVNEVRFFFEIITKSDAGFTSDTVVFKKYMSNGRTTFTYDNLQSVLNLQLTYRSDIEYRRLGKASLEIWTGYGSFPMLPNRQEINYYNNDYTVPGSPKIPTVFIYGGTVGTNRVEKLELDYLTHEAVANDTILSRFRFVKW
ncbi:MAG: hypothetical protein WC865_14740 [Bacteroidales bacterium]